MHSGLIGRLALTATLLAAPALARATHVERESARSVCTDDCARQYYQDMLDCYSDAKRDRKDCTSNASDGRKVCRAVCPKTVRTSRRR
jgi:hypothetical protein